MCVCVFPLRLECAQVWQVVGSFRIRCRIVDPSRVVNSAEEKLRLGLQLYKVQRGIYLLDLVLLKGDAFTFLNSCARIIAELKVPAAAVPPGAFPPLFAQSRACRAHRGVPLLRLRDAWLYTAYSCRAPDCLVTRVFGYWRSWCVAGGGSAVSASAASAAAAAVSAPPVGAVSVPQGGTGLSGVPASVGVGGSGVHGVAPPLPPVAPVPNPDAMDTSETSA